MLRENYDLSKDRLKKIIGKNIRAIRESRGFTTEMLSEILGISSSFLGLIERGQRGTTAHNLYKISEAFSMSIDDIVSINEYDHCINDDNPIKEKREQINSYLYNFNLDELYFIFKFLKLLSSFKNNNIIDDSNDNSFE
jgi:transcriptional regulator with XRE-family HTH domain